MKECSWCGREGVLGVVKRKHSHSSASDTFMNYTNIKLFNLCTLSCMSRHAPAEAWTVRSMCVSPATQTHSMTLTLCRLFDSFVHCFPCTTNCTLGRSLITHLRLDGDKVPSLPTPWEDTVTGLLNRVLMLYNLSGLCSKTRNERAKLLNTGLVIFSDVCCSSPLSWPWSKLRESLKDTIIFLHLIKQT